MKMDTAATAGAIAATGRSVITAPFRAVIGLGMSGLSTIQSILFATWVYYYFWIVPQRVGDAKIWLGIFTPERVPFNMAWIAIGYLTIGVMAAATSNYEKGWKVSTPILNLGTSFLAVLALALSLWEPKIPMATAARFGVGRQ